MFVILSKKRNQRGPKVFNCGQKIEGQKFHTFRSMKSTWLNNTKSKNTAKNK